jgi:hypothetical protein
MLPFRNLMPDAHVLTSGRHWYAARFMAGRAPPSIGGVARLFDAASRSYCPSEDELTTRFRDAISQSLFGNPRMLRSGDLVGRLIQLARAGAAQRTWGTVSGRVASGYSLRY